MSGRPGYLRVALVGLGPIGLEVGRALMARAGVHLLGAADPAPDKAGQDLGQLLTGQKSSYVVDAKASDLYARTQDRRGKTDVVVLCTGSRLERVAGQIEEAVRAGFHVISTCEELSFPYLRHARLAQRLDQLAREKEVGILGIGVNPGLVMDRLPLLVATACVSVEHVRVERVVDAGTRRGPLRAKVGYGLTVEEFEKGVAEGRLGHVGLGESAALIARGLRAFLDEVPETIEPVVGADGKVLGVRQMAKAVAQGKVVAELHLQMSVGAENPHDRIVVTGDPPVEVVVPGGFAGDRATIGAVVNSLPYLLSGPHGLRTGISLPLFGLFPVRAMEEIEV